MLVSQYMNSQNSPKAMCYPTPCHARHNMACHARCYAMPCDVVTALVGRAHSLMSCHAMCYATSCHVTLSHATHHVRRAYGHKQACTPALPRPCLFDVQRHSEAESKCITEAESKSILYPPSLDHVFKLFLGERRGIRVPARICHFRLLPNGLL